MDFYTAVSYRWERIPTSELGELRDALDFFISKGNGMDNNLASDLRYEIGLEVTQRKKEGNDHGSPGNI